MKQFPYFLAKRLQLPYDLNNVHGV